MWNPYLHTIFVIVSKFLLRDILNISQTLCLLRDTTRLQKIYFSKLLCLPWNSNSHFRLKVWCNLRRNEAVQEVELGHEACSVPQFTRHRPSWHKSHLAFASHLSVGLHTFSVVSRDLKWMFLHLKHISQKCSWFQGINWTLWNQITADIIFKTIHLLSILINNPYSMIWATSKLEIDRMPSNFFIIQ